MGYIGLETITREEVNEAMSGARAFPDSPSGVNPGRIERLLNVFAKERMPLILDKVGDNEKFGIYADFWLPNWDFVGVCDNGHGIEVVLIDDKTNSVKLNFVCKTTYEAYEKVKFIVEDSMAA